MAVPGLRGGKVREGLCLQGEDGRKRPHHSGGWLPRGHGADSAWSATAAQLLSVGARARSGRIAEKSRGGSDESCRGSLATSRPVKVSLYLRGAATGFRQVADDREGQLLHGTKYRAAMWPI